MNGGVPGAAVGSQQTFDLSNQSDVLALLNFVRGSTLDVDLQNETRNAVLDYTTDSQSVDMAELVATLEPLGATIVGQTTEKAATPKPSAEQSAPVIKKRVFGNIRRRPNFAQVMAKQIVENKSPTNTDTESSAATPEPAPAVSATSTEMQVPQTEMLNEVTPEKEETSVATEQSTVDPMTRIKEIKRIVNEKVGNPVNLIDTNNEVGREYMNALLESMKAVNSGQGVGEAMQRLEAAFGAVETTLAANPVSESDDSKTVDTEPEPAEEVSETPPVESSPAEEVVEEPVVSTPAPVVPTPPPPVPKSQPEIPATTDAAAEITPNPAESTSPSKPVSTGGLRSLAADLAHQGPAVDTASPDSNSDIDPEKATSTATTIPPKEQSAVPPVDEKAAEPTTADSLQDPKITAGLDQLLSEWSLFKSSGLFGTGPSGREHPLYKKVATLPMSSVIAGRFEGATPQIKQSFTDYMNGWRYEHGVVHEMSEQFEHYLRRVIKTILAKQPKAN